MLEPTRQQQVHAKAIWSDGVERDITTWALWDSRDKRIAEVSATGEVEALEPGSTPVSVRYMGQVATVNVTRPTQAAAMT